MDTAQEQQNIVSEFLNKTSEFTRLYNYLAAELPNIQGTPLENEARQILIDGEKKRSLIDNVKFSLDSALKAGAGVWDSITDWFDSVTGSTPEVASDGLGLLPFVLAAGVVSSVAGATYTLDNWLSKGRIMSQKIETFKDFKAQGYGTTEAAVLANKLIADQAVKGPLDTILKIVGVGVIGLFIWKWKK